MKSLRRWTPVLLLVLLTSMAGGWLGSRLNHTALREHADFHAAVLKSIELTSSQRRALDELEVRHIAEQEAMREKVRAATDALAAVLARKSSYDDEVEAAIDTNHRLLGALQQVTLRQLFEMRAVLDAGQQVEFDRLVASSLRGAVD